MKFKKIEDSNYIAFEHLSRDFWILIESPERIDVRLFSSDGEIIHTFGSTQKCVNDINKKIKRKEREIIFLKNKMQELKKIDIKKLFKSK